jgi:hypothetical protein
VHRKQHPKVETCRIGQVARQKMVSAGELRSLCGAAIFPFALHLGQSDRSSKDKFYV